MSNCGVYAKLALVCCFLCCRTAFTKPTNKGWGLATVLLYSGWYWTPMNQGCEGISMISTSPVSLLMPEAISPAFSSRVFIFIVEFIPVPVPLRDLGFALIDLYVPSYFPPAHNPMHLSRMVPPLFVMVFCSSIRLITG